MKRIILAAIAAMTMHAGAASALSINFATGQGSNGSPGAFDPLWTESGGIYPYQPGRLLVVGSFSNDWYPHWGANSSTSSWIAPNPYSSSGNGQFTAEYAFDLSDYNLSTAVFANMAWEIDDQGMLSLNGNVLSTHVWDQWYNGLQAVDVPVADLLPGTNVLAITETSTDDFYEGVRMEGSLTIDPVPEPAGLAVFGLGMLGLLGARRSLR